jgi:hypothetical protein
MIKKLSTYLFRIGVDHEIDLKDKALTFDVDTPQGTWHCSILIDNNLYTKGGMGFYSTLPARVPIGLLNHMALFLMCLNNDRLFGNFELDPDTGDLHFKTYIDFENRVFSEKAVERNMLINISIMQKHMPRLMRMINCA